MLSAALVSTALAAAVAQFPFGPAVLHSPDGTWQITNEDPVGNEASHRLILRHEGGAGRTLYSYGRHLRVAWSPDSRRIAITDYVGSNVAECVVVDADTLHRTDVMADAARTSDRIARVLRNFHSYFECPGWVSPTVLRVRASGYGDSDPKGAAVNTTYRLKVR
jgi:hypothetical protein